VWFKYAPKIHTKNGWLKLLGHQKKFPFGCNFPKKAINQCWNFRNPCNLQAIIKKYAPEKLKPEQE
jgi:hypothetical protein